MDEAAIPAIQVDNVSKVYKIWAYPRARVSGSIAERLSRAHWLPGSIKARLRRFRSSVCRDFAALRDVSIAIQRGETFGIVGRNGSGKSTLLQIIAGVLQPTSGAIRVNGRVAALLELGAGFNPEFTGRENVYLNASVFGLSRREVDERFDEIASFADIGEFMDEPVKTYSSGMMVRLGFSVQTAIDPDILIIDEALSVGDETFQRKCFSRLERIREAGKTILFVSHDLGSVLTLCRRAMFLHRGELVAIGEPKPVVNAYQRVAHSPSDRVATVLAQIRKEALTNGEVRTDSNVVVAKPAPEVPRSPGQESKDSHSRAAGISRSTAEAFFDEGLTSQSIVQYDSLGAEIHDVGVFDERDRKVNVLARRGVYTFRYCVKFTRDCNDISFAMLIKTLKGQELGGYSTNTEAIPVVRSGQQFEVRFRFHCLLRPWVYYFNAGVEGPVDDKRAYAHRLIDAYAIRIKDESETKATGIVDFLIEPSFQAVEPSVELQEISLTATSVR